MGMTRFVRGSALLLFLGCVAVCVGPIPEVLPEIQTKTIELGPLTIDRIYPSMDGPFKRTRFDYRGMDWISAFRTQVVDAHTGEKMGEEFFCHSQLQLDNAIRLVVNATGIPDIQFPEGFGMPLTQILRGIPSEWRGLFLMGMVLNNHEADINRQVNVRITIEYMDFGGDTPPGRLKKLYKAGLPMTAEPKPDDPFGGHHLIEGMEQHWIVPPGRQITRKRYSNIIPVNGQVHYGVVHLHNYGVYMRVTDVTAGDVLWQTNAVYEADRIQIAEIPPYSSAEGFSIYKDHEYEIETLYDNTSDEPVDAMAMMYLFYHPNGNQNITYPEPPPGRVRID